MQPKKGGTQSALPPPPKNVAEYAQHYCNIALDPSLPAVKLTSSLGIEVIGYLDAYRSLNAACTAYVLGNQTREMLRNIARNVVTEAIKANLDGSRLIDLAVESMRSG